MVRISGAQAVIKSLEELGIDLVFGIPGGAILEVYNSLFSSSIRHILVRHEQGAGHAAEGYACSSGKLGVCLATSGPGATNLVTAIADAYMDSVPILAITGQVYSHLLGSDAFQESDIIGITMPITKHAFSVKRATEIPAAIFAGAKIATTGRPGPVLIDITKDAQQDEFDFMWPPKSIDLSGYSVAQNTPDTLAQFADGFFDMLSGSIRPVIYAGGGTVRSGASEELIRFAEGFGIPVVTTLTARGVLPDSNRLNLGMPGMHGTVAAILALQKSDLLIALGTRFDDRVTGRLDSFAQNARVVHVDIDPAEIGKNRRPDLFVIGDVKEVLGYINSHSENKTTGDLTAWWRSLEKMRQIYPLVFPQKSSDGNLSPGYVIKRLGELSGPDAIYATGVGQHQMWASQAISFSRPNSFLTSGGAGTMGYAVPAAMGAKAANPEKIVWAIDGDGCFQMTNQELATCSVNGLPIKVAVINNRSLGMVRQWQGLFYNKRYSQTDLNTGDAYIPDFCKLAESYSCASCRVSSVDEVDNAIEFALAINDRPVVIDFVVCKDSMVWPMVPQGLGNSHLKYLQDVSPVWHDNE